MFKQAGLDLLIGKRTWGGLWAPVGTALLSAGFRSGVRRWQLDRAMGLEEHGADADIPVENEPASVIAGNDPQLERGIGGIMKEPKANTKVLPSHAHGKTPKH
jgi:tricorn protease